MSCHRGVDHMTVFLHAGAESLATSVIDFRRLIPVVCPQRVVEPLLLLFLLAETSLFYATAILLPPALNRSFGQKTSTHVLTLPIQVFTAEKSPYSGVEPGSRPLIAPTTFSLHQKVTSTVQSLRLFQQYLTFHVRHSCDASKLTRRPLLRQCVELVMIF